MTLPSPPPEVEPSGPPTPLADLPQAERPLRALGVTSLVLGVLALFGCWVPWFTVAALVLAVGGVVIGAIAALHRRGTARAWGVAGVATSVVALAVITMLLAVSAVGALLIA